MSKFKKKLPEKVLIDNKVNTRSFEYKYGNVGLGFSLVIDSVKDPKDFLVCLKKAVEDITEIVEGFNK